MRSVYMHAHGHMLMSTIYIDQLCVFEYLILRPHGHRTDSVRHVNTQQSV